MHAIYSKMDQLVILSCDYSDAKVRKLRELVEVLTTNMNNSLDRRLLED